MGSVWNKVAAQKSIMNLRVVKLASPTTPHISHLTPHTQHLTPHTSHTTPQTSHLTHNTSHLTPHTSHLTPHTPHLTPHTSSYSYVDMGSEAAVEKALTFNHTMLGSRCAACMPPQSRFNVFFVPIIHSVTCAPQARGNQAQRSSPPPLGQQRRRQVCVRV